MWQNVRIFLIRSLILLRVRKKKGIFSYRRTLPPVLNAGRSFTTRRTAGICIRLSTAPHAGPGSPYWILCPMTGCGPVWGNFPCVRNVSMSIPMLRPGGTMPSRSAAMTVGPRHICWRKTAKKNGAGKRLPWCARPLWTGKS